MQTYSPSRFLEVAFAPSPCFQDRSVNLNTVDKVLDLSFREMVSPKGPLSFMTAIISARLGVPSPKLYIVHDDGANALSYSQYHDRQVIRVIAVTDGLLRRFNPLGIVVSLAHEIGHLALESHPEIKSYQHAIHSQYWSHWNEYAADAAAARLFGVAAAETTLEKLADELGLQAFSQSSPTHPSFASRIEAVQDGAFADVWRHIHVRQPPAYFPGEPR